jgi:hypothetical protein
MAPRARCSRGPHGAELIPVKCRQVGQERLAGPRDLDQHFALVPIALGAPDQLGLRQLVHESDCGMVLDAEACGERPHGRPLRRRQTLACKKQLMLLRLNAAALAALSLKLRKLRI